MFIFFRENGELLKAFRHLAKRLGVAPSLSKKSPGSIFSRELVQFHKKASDKGAMAERRKQIRNGSFLGACKIVRLMGRGSMGETYEARDTLLDRHAVVKVVSPFIENLEEVTRRFKRTGQALARINHQNIATVYALKEADSVQYIVMEFVEGRSLKDVIKNETKLSPGQAVKCFRQVLEGVKTLHDASIFHQDIKPKNIIIRHDNFVKVVDFGIGRVDGQGVVSTIYYLAPEVIDGAPGSIQSDIWSLGISLYETLTGEKPFQSEDWAEVVHKIAHEALTFPEGPDDTTPYALQKIVLKMCEKEPSKRYGSIAEILEDLRALEAGGMVAVPKELNLSVPIEIVPDLPPFTALALEKTIGSGWNRTQSSSLERFGGFTGSVSKVRVEKPLWKKVFPIASIVAFAMVAYFIYQSNGSLEEGVEKTAAANEDSPSEGQQVRLKGSELVKFVWSQPTRAGIYLEIAKENDFNELALREAFRSSPYWPTRPLKEGKYFWRLVDQSVTPARSLTEPTMFSIVNDNPPQVMFPAHRYEAHEMKDMQFFWLHKFGISTYRLQISANSSFDALVTNVLVHGIQSNPITLSPGEYFWRLRAEDKASSFMSLWSETRVFKLPGAVKLVKAEPVETPKPVPTAAPERIEPPAPPPMTAEAFQIERPAPKAFVPAKAPRKPAPPPAKKTVAVAKPIARPPVAKKQEVKRKPEPVVEIEEEVTVVAPPKLKHRNVANAPVEAALPNGPALKLPPNGVSIVAFNGNQDPISFRWQAKDFGAVYRLQLAREPNFSKILMNVQSRENQYVITKKLPEGVFFWRVRAEGPTATAWSNVFSFEISK
jgi:serine/threonine protein kinase